MHVDLVPYSVARAPTGLLRTCYRSLDPWCDTLRLNAYPRPSKHKTTASVSPQCLGRDTTADEIRGHGSRVETQRSRWPGNSWWSGGHIVAEVCQLFSQMVTVHGNGNENGNENGNGIGRVEVSKLSMSPVVRDTGRWNTATIRLGTCSISGSIPNAAVGDDTSVCLHHSCPRIPSTLGRNYRHAFCLVSREKTLGFINRYMDRVDAPCSSSALRLVDVLALIVSDSGIKIVKSRKPQPMHSHMQLLLPSEYLLSGPRFFCHNRPVTERGKRRGTA